MSRRNDIFHQVERQDRPVGKMARRAARAGLLASLGNVGIKRAIAVHQAKPPVPNATAERLDKATADAIQTMTATEFEAFRAKVSQEQGRPVGRDEIMEAVRAAAKPLE